MKDQILRLAARIRELDTKFRSIDDENIGQTNLSVEVLKNELFGHYIVTHDSAFKPERPIFTATADGQFFCQKIEEAIDQYEGFRSVQCG